MNRSSFHPLLAALAVLSGTGMTHASPLDSDADARLRALHAAPDRAGSLVYRGRVHEPDAARDAVPPYTYERRVAPAGSGLSATHLTRDARGELVISETAQITAGYALQRFEAINRQQGYSGSVIVSEDGRRLSYRLLRDDGQHTAQERVEHAVVAGPSLHGYIAEHWDALMAGATLPVRMVVLAKMTTYGFEIRRHAPATNRAVFTVTPTQWLVRLAVAPLVVTFDPRTREVVRYEGRVPPLRVVNGKPQDFDARVDYTMLAPAYR